eukprot:1901537-Rhodomonas_salina.2
MAPSCRLSSHHDGAMSGADSDMMSESAWLSVLRGTEIARREQARGPESDASLGSTILSSHAIPYAVRGLT